MTEVRCHLLAVDPMAVVQMPTITQTDEDNGTIERRLSISLHPVGIPINKYGHRGQGSSWILSP